MWTQKYVNLTSEKCVGLLQEGLQVRCSNNYTMTCVKRDVLLFLDSMDGERSYELYPGFTLFQRRSSSAGMLPSNESLDAANSSQLDHMIAKRLNDYVESIDLRVRLLNPINATARSVGNSMLERILPFLRMSMTKRIMLLFTVKSLHYLLPKLLKKLRI
ncbi:unnamed protein product [Macrosiphum euphorbiae]|uniref:Uncharacterized protein n=1 Tax=Macrosiphum euphorbiae TaxID=13131 RepID=A0AAV0XM58_9HEMI|nr:unnamed protein product [Macrosiphum euphorbiae]